MYLENSITFKQIPIVKPKMWNNPTRPLDFKTDEEIVAWVVWCLISLFTSKETEYPREKCLKISESPGSQY